MMPLDKQFDVDDARKRAMLAFWSQGYDATSTQDLLDRMAINRASLYATFGSKRALFLDCLRDYLINVRRPAFAAAVEGRTSRSAIEHLFLTRSAQRAEDCRPSGCLLVNTAIELAPKDEEIRKIVEAGFLETEIFIRTLIEQGQECGEIPRHVDAMATARTFLSMLVGLRVLMRGAVDDTTPEAIAARAMALLE